jgi:molybdopterin molybdotransferase
MTGAPFPVVVDEHGQEVEDGYDACVKLELVVAEYGLDRQLESITLTAPVPRNANRRLAGEDIRVGDVLLREGETVRKEHVMVLASMGIQDIEVRTRSIPPAKHSERPLRIGIINTGKEVVLNQPRPDITDSTLISLDPSAQPTKLGTSQIWNSNGPYIHATLLSLGFPASSVTVLRIPLAPNQNGDDPLAFQSLVRSALESAEPYDILISTGGVSMGTHDYVPSSILALDGQIGFHKIRMRPGGPMLFAHLENARGGRTGYFGLPGNPVAAAVCMRFIVGPAILRMRDGDAVPTRGQMVKIRGPEIVQRKPALSRMYVPAIIRPGSSHGTPEVEALARGSNMTLGLVRADGWVCFPDGEGRDTVADGDLVELYEM